MSNSSSLRQADHLELEDDGNAHSRTIYNACLAIKHQVVFPHSTVTILPNPRSAFCYQSHRSNLSPLPLRLLAIEKRLDDSNDLVERSEVLAQLLLDLLLVVAELGVEVLAVGAGGHGGAEDGLDEEAVVRLERDAVGAAERVRQLVVVVRQVLA